MKSVLSCRSSSSCRNTCSAPNPRSHGCPHQLSSFVYVCDVLSRRVLPPCGASPHPSPESNHTRQSLGQRQRQLQRTTGTRLVADLSQPSSSSTSSSSCGARSVAAEASSGGQQSSSSSAAGGGGHFRLIMLRHADSDGYSSGVRDHEREITTKGKQEAAAIAQQLMNMGWVPDVVLASNSKRTKQTLDAMANVMLELGEVDTHLYGSLYTVAALDGQTRKHIEECLLEVVDEVRHTCVMCVGHNKGWEEAASSMAGRSVKLETACAALFQSESGPWKDVVRATFAEARASADLTSASFDEVYKTQIGGWKLLEVVQPKM